jgi:hypothetical protein
MNAENLSKKLSIPGGSMQCPHCLEVLSRMSTSTGEAKLAPFSVAVCARCGEVSWYNPDKKCLRKAGSGDLEFLRENGVLTHQDVDVIRRASEFIKRDLQRGIHDVSIPKIAHEIFK